MPQTLRQRKTQQTFLLLLTARLVINNVLFELLSPFTINEIILNYGLVMWRRAMCRRGRAFAVRVCSFTRPHT